MDISYYINRAPAMQKISKSALQSPLYKPFVISGFTIRLNEQVLPCFVAPVLAMDRKMEPRIFPMKWGFSSPRASLLPFIRSDRGLHTQLHRCVVPASWFRADGILYLPSDSSSLWLAGIYTLEGSLPAFSVFTNQASQPISLSRTHVLNWINPGSDPADILSNGLSPCVIG